MESLSLMPNRPTWPSKRAGSFTSPRASLSHHREVKSTPAAFGTWIQQRKLFGSPTCKANNQRQTKGGSFFGHFSSSTESILSFCSISQSSRCTLPTNNIVTSVILVFLELTFFIFTNIWII